MTKMMQMRRTMKRCCSNNKFFKCNDSSNNKIDPPTILARNQAPTKEVRPRKTSKVKLLKTNLLTQQQKSTIVKKLSQTRMKTRSMLAGLASRRHSNSSRHNLNSRKSLARPNHSNCSKLKRKKQMTMMMMTMTNKFQEPTIRLNLQTCR